jgi:hypothetical protein
VEDVTSTTTYTAITDPSGAFLLQATVSDSSVFRVHPADPYQSAMGIGMPSPGVFDILPDTLVLVPVYGPTVLGSLVTDLGDSLEGVFEWVSSAGDTTLAGIDSSSFVLPPAELRSLGAGYGGLRVQLTHAGFECTVVDTQTVFFPLGADTVDLGDIVFASSPTYPSVVLDGKLLGEIGGQDVGVPGIHVEIKDLGSGQIIAEDYTDATGAYRVEFPPGTWQMRILNALTQGLCVDALYETVHFPACQETVFMEITYPTGPCDSTVVAVPPDAGTNPVRLSAYPNPFSGQVHLSVSGYEGWAELDVFDIRGARVSQVWSGDVSEGTRLSWGGTSEHGGAVSAGIYFARLRYEGGQLSRRLILVK